MTPIRHLGWTALALFALAGCGDTTAPTAATPSTGPAADPGKAAPEIKAMPVDPGKADGPKKEASADKALTPDQIAEIKKLPADEQPIALAQMTCPVSGDALGEMGAPIKQVVGGKTFYLCCAGCEKAVKEHPAEVVAKLKK